MGCVVEPNIYYNVVIYIMKLDRTSTIELLRRRIIELAIENCAPQFENYSNQEIIKACVLYRVSPFYFV